MEADGPSSRAMRLVRVRPLSRPQRSLLPIAAGRPACIETAMLAEAVPWRCRLDQAGGRRPDDALRGKAWQAYRGTGASRSPGTWRDDVEAFDVPPILTRAQAAGTRPVWLDDLFDALQRDAGRVAARRTCARALAAASSWASTAPRLVCTSRRKAYSALVELRTASVGRLWMVFREQLQAIDPCLSYDNCRLQRSDFGFERFECRMSAIIAFNTAGSSRSSWRSPSMPANRTKIGDLWLYLACLNHYAAASANALRPYQWRTARARPVHPFDERGELGRGHEPSPPSSSASKTDPLRAFFGEQAQARTVPPDNLYPICSLGPENVERAVEGSVRRRAPAQSAHPDPFAGNRRSGRQHDARVRRNHARRAARMSSTTRLSARLIRSAGSRPPRRSRRSQSKWMPQVPSWSLGLFSRNESAVPHLRSS